MTTSDVVAMEAVDKKWARVVQECIKQSGGSVRLWSFEIKKEITRVNVRASFFQVVSDSSWANAGYMVTSSIQDRILSDLHGIGVIVLNIDNIMESEMVFSVKHKTNID